MLAGLEGFHRCPMPKRLLPDVMVVQPLVVPQRASSRCRPESKWRVRSRSAMRPLERSAIPLVWGCLGRIIRVVCSRFGQWDRLPRPGGSAAYARLRG